VAVRFSRDNRQPNFPPGNQSPRNTQQCQSLFKPGPEERERPHFAAQNQFCTGRRDFANAIESAVRYWIAFRPIWRRLASFKVMVVTFVLDVQVIAVHRETKVIIGESIVGPRGGFSVCKSFNISSCPDLRQRSRRARLKQGLV
jgi:hypothetical protein